MRLSRPRREFILAPLAGLALSAALSWPALRHPATTIPEDLGDPPLQAWQLAWIGHAATHHPAGIWDAPILFPAKDALAFSDSLLGYLPFGLLGTGPTAALVRYNLLYVLVGALAFTGMYALARQLGARWQGAALAGVVFACAPWRLAHAGHLNILSTGGIALALAMLARGHGYSWGRGYVPDRVRPLWIVGGWAVACWQLLLGFGLGLPFAYALGLLVVVAAIGWLVAGRPQVSRGLVVADAVGGVVFAAVGGLMSLPYLRVVHDHPDARRTLAEIALFSPPIKGFLAAPAESTWWGAAHAARRTGLTWPPEMTLFPGLVVIVLAAMGVLFGAWRLRTRLMLLAVVLASGVLAMGTAGPDKGKYGYIPLYHHLPGWDAIRTPSRLIVWTTLALALLAAGALGTPAQTRARSTAARVALGVALAVPAVVAVGEGLNHVPHPQVPTAPAAFATLRGPAVVLPINSVGDTQPMIWSTRTFPQLVNGDTGYFPPTYQQTIDATPGFPDAASVDYLKRLGVRTVVVLPDRIGGTPWADALTRPVNGLAVDRTDTPGAVLFTLR